MLGITETGSVRASQWLQREHAEDTVSHLAGPGCSISQNIIRNELNTSLHGQTEGLVGVCPALSHRNRMKLGIGFT